MKIMIEIAPGELADRLSILEIKLSKINDENKLKNIRYEYASLARGKTELFAKSPEVERLANELKVINDQIWIIEDDIRELERKRDFGDRFVAVARSVYQTNDKRAAVKRQINELLQSVLVEEKSYTPY